MQDCTITLNAKDGIGPSHYYGGANEATVIRSTITDNGQDGLFANVVNVSDSVFVNNGEVGISFSQLGTNGLIGNRIEGNQVGIYVNSSAPIVTNIVGNDVFGNMNHELQNKGAAAVIADGDFWGEPTTTELNNQVVDLSKIYDSRDNVSVGQVVIRNWSQSSLMPEAPLIVMQPASQLVIPGANVSFNVVAVGTYPMTYLWQHGATAITWAANATLTLTNVQPSDAGSYLVTVSNGLGSTNSAVAILTVDQSALASVLSLEMYAGLTFSGIVGKSYSIQYVNDFSLTNNWSAWTTLTNLTLPNSPFQFVDWSSPGSSRRFYRAVQMP